MERDEIRSLMHVNINSERSADMRTLLRNVPTGLYVQSAGAWTGSSHEALDFKTMSRAIGFVEQAGLRKMELAFESSDLSRLTEVPLDKLSWGSSVSRRWNPSVPAAA
jgi:hypothetical protein